MYANAPPKFFSLLTVSLLLSGFCPGATASGEDVGNQPGVKGTSTLSLEVSQGDPLKLKDKQALGEPVAAHLKNHRFDELESIADQVRKNDVHYADGRMKLEFLYNGLEAGRKASDEEYKAHLDDIRLWIKEKPNSATAAAALVSNLNGWAWKARGSGYAHSVSSAQFGEFTKRLKEANQALEEGRKLSKQCPHLYVGGQTVGLGQSWAKAKYDAFVSEGIKKFPTYYEIYFRKAYFLQPRWYGEDNEWVQYASRTADSSGGAAGGATGDKLFARIVWAVDNYNFYNNIFSEFSELKWSKVKSGFEALKKEYPDNLSVASEFCKLAWCAKDEKTAKSLMTYLGKRCDISVWKKKARFLEARLALLGLPAMPSAAMPSGAMPSQQK